MAARTRRGVIGGIRMSDEWKDKIRVSKIMARMEQGALGEVNLTTEQIAAAKLLLSKVVPDLARTEHSGVDGEAIKVSNVDLSIYTTAELEALSAMQKKALAAQQRIK